MRDRVTEALQLPILELQVPDQRRTRLRKLTGRLLSGPKEVGLARYERLQGFDDSSARRYRERTEPFWAEVRAAWADVSAHHQRVTLRAAPDRGELFVPLFEYADRLAEGAPLDREDAARFARSAVHSYLRDSPSTRRE